MKLTLFIYLICLSLTSFAQNTEAFLVEISDQRIKVTSPLKKSQIVSIIVKNETFEKIISELRSEDKVLKRFVLKPEGQEVTQVDYSKIKELYYVPVSPPFEAARLRFTEKPYEIPEESEKSKETRPNN